MNISNSRDVLEYFDLLNEIKNTSLILIGVKDNAGYFLDSSIQAKLNILGLNESLIHESMVGYIAVICRGRVVYESKSENGGFEEYKDNIESNSVYMLSMPYNNGNVCSIKVNNIEYSVNMRGLNVVAYDLDNDALIDRVAFDTHVKDISCINLKEHYDIGIFGWWYNLNYGAVLTYYALYKALYSLGYSALMLFRSTTNASMPHNIPIEFALSHYEVGPRVEEKDLYQYNNYCDSFVLGSDQLWNPDLDSFSGKQFFFDFVDTSKRKIAYAQSFGNYTELPQWFRNNYSKYVFDFTAVSVREDYAVGLCENDFHIYVDRVCDPVFLLETSDYSCLSDEANVNLPGKYLLGFLLDPNDKKIEFCKSLAKEIDVPNVVFLTDLDHSDEKKVAFGSENVLLNARIEDFIKAYKNADYVITDSFHGTCFSIIFNKKFISIPNVGRGAGRFLSLIEHFKLNARILDEYELDATQHLEIIKQEINYSEVNDIIKEDRQFSLLWLKNSLSSDLNSKVKRKPFHEANVLRSINYKECTGCGACNNICPVDAISMKKDKDGFLLPEVDEDKCIACGKCSNICPIISSYFENRSHPKCYAVAADDKTRFHSSSGGFFAMAAKWVIENGGVVCGAAYDFDFSVYHRCISNVIDLDSLQKSKYAQSEIRYVYREIVEYARRDMWVLFVGTPCQVAALRNILKNQYKKVILVDLLCGGVPSSQMLIDYLRENFDFDCIKKIDFRPKETGWNSSCLSVAFKDHTKKILNMRESEYEQGYHKYLTKRECCTKCQFCGIKRQGDLSIGDFWGIDNYQKNYNDKKGLSVVLSNNDKGDIFIDHIKGRFDLFEETPFEVARHNSLCINRKAHINKPQFHNLYSLYGFTHSVKKCTEDGINKDTQHDIKLENEIKILKKRIEYLESMLMK